MDFNDLGQGEVVGAPWLSEVLQKQSLSRHKSDNRLQFRHSLPPLRSACSVNILMVPLLPPCLQMACCIRTPALPAMRGLFTVRGSFADIGRSRCSLSLSLSSNVEFVLHSKGETKSKTDTKPARHIFSSGKPVALSGIWSRKLSSGLNQPSNNLIRFHSNSRLISSGTFGLCSPCTNSAKSCAGSLPVSDVLRLRLRLTLYPVFPDSDSDSNCIRCSQTPTPTHPVSG